MAPPRTVCRHWRENKCKYGDRCRFLHNLTPGNTGQPSNSRSIHPSSRYGAMMKDTVRAVCSIDLAELGNGYEGPVGLKNYQFLASYNWANTEAPTIFVPGCPSRWTPPSLPIRLCKDNSKVLKDQTLPRRPKHSFEPLFKSLLAMNPDFSMDPISLVSNRNNLRKLFNFVSNRRELSFRIDVDIVQNTLFFNRWEQSYGQLVNGWGDSGYGHEFEKAFTTEVESFENNLGHHRIAQYTLGDMKCLVQFEADAYIDDSPGPKGASLDGTSTGEVSPTDEGGVSIILQSVSLGSPQGDTSVMPLNEVRVIQSGRVVPPAAVIEIKSRSAKLRMGDIIPQLWFSQTGHLFVGYHRDGLVDKEIERYEMATYFKNWEEQHAEQLQKLVFLVSRIREAVQGTPGKKGAIIYHHSERPGKLRIYETSGTGLLSLLGEEKKSWSW